MSIESPLADVERRADLHRREEANLDVGPPIDPNSPAPHGLDLLRKALVERYLLPENFDFCSRLDINGNPAVFKTRVLEPQTSVDAPGFRFFHNMVEDAGA